MMLKFIVFNYIKYKNVILLKVLFRVVNWLKKREDIVVIRLDKGLGVVIFNKDMYVVLLKKVFIDDNIKFVLVSFE